MEGKVHPPTPSPPTRTTYILSLCIYALCMASRNAADVQPQFFKFRFQSNSEDPSIFLPDVGLPRIVALRTHTFCQPACFGGPSKNRAQSSASPRAAFNHLASCLNTSPVWRR